MRIKRYSKHIPSTLSKNLSKNFWKREQFSIVLKDNNGDLLSSNGGFSTFAKLMLLRLLVLVVRDSVITLSAIAYNVSNNLDEVLLVMVCAVYSGNIISRSRLVLKVAFTRAFAAFESSVLVRRQAGSHAEGS